MDENEAIADEYWDEIHEYWDDARKGLPPDDAPWNWELINEEKNGRTKKPPDHRGKWYRWYLTYHKPECTNVKISVDEDDKTGRLFNPHPSSGTL